MVLGVSRLGLWLDFFTRYKTKLYDGGAGVDIKNGRDKEV